MFDLYHKYHFIGEHSVLYGLVLYPPFKNVLKWIINPYYSSANAHLVIFV